MLMNYRQLVGLCHLGIRNLILKSYNRRKLFKGRVVRCVKDLIGCGDTNGNQEVYVSEILIEKI